MAVPRLGSVLLCKRLFVSGKTQVGPSLGQTQYQGAGLATSAKLCDIFFTKKHEWVRVEGTKGIVLNERLEQGEATFHTIPDMYIIKIRFVLLF